MEYETSNKVLLQLDSDKQSFGLDNVPIFIKIEAALSKYNVLKIEVIFSVL